MKKVPRKRLVLAGIVVLVLLVAIGLFHSLGLHGRESEGERTPGMVAAPGEPPRARPADHAAAQHVPPHAGVEDIALPAKDHAIARWFTPGRKRIEDARTVWQGWENQYIQFLKEETFVKGLRRGYILSELIHVRGSFDVLDPDNPAILSTLSKSRRFSKLLAHVSESKADGNAGRSVALLQDNARRYLLARTALEKNILKLMADEPKLFRAGERLSKRQIHRVGDMFRGFGTIKRTVPRLPTSATGTSLGLVTISFLLGQTEDARAVGPLLEIVDRDDATFLRKLNKPGNRLLNATPTANRDVIADALDRILVAESLRAAKNSSAGKIAKEYLQWRESANLPERRTVSVYAYDEPVTPYGLVGSIRRPGPTARTVPLSLPMMEPKRGFSERPSKEMAKKIAIILDWARRLQATRR